MIATTPTNGEWREVKPASPCPICAKGDWCGRSGDAIRCMRADNFPMPGGWHIIKRSPDGGVVCRFEDAQSSSPKRIVATYDYHDESGKLLFQVVRFEPKDFRQRGADGSWSVKGVRKVLYKLPELLAADPGEWVFIVEGEKDCDNLARLGMIATCNVGGAGKWLDAYSTFLKGRRVCLLPDNDDAGRNHVEAVARSLTGIAASIRVVELPNLPNKGDVSDWLAAQPENCDCGDLLIGLAEEATEWEEAENVTPTADATRLSVRRLSSFEPKEVDWLWPDRFPVGMLSILGGDPGAGKSTIILDMAARITTGTPWPDDRNGTNPVGEVLLVTAEDSISHTVRRRFDNAKGDPDRVHILSGLRQPQADYDSLLNLDQDVRHLGEYLESNPKIRMVAIDPIDAFLGSECDSHRKTDVQRVLGFLKDLAEARHVAVIGVAHLKKSSDNTKAIYRLLGSMGFTSAPRAVWGVERDRDDRSRRTMTVIKSSEASDPTGLGFSIIDAGVIAWEAEPVLQTCDEVFGQRPQGRTALQDAEQWLEELLAVGPVESKRIEGEARKAGITPGTLKRAKNAIGAKARKRPTGEWEWRLIEGAQGGY